MLGGHAASHRAARRVEVERSTWRQGLSTRSTLKTTGLNQSVQPTMTVPGCRIPGMFAPIAAARMSLRMSAQTEVQKPSGTDE